MSVCVTCQREVGRLASHKRYTHSVEKFNCDICNHVSTTAGGLTSHRRRHEHEISIKCPNCNSSFIEYDDRKNKHKFCSHSCAAIYNNKIGKLNGRKFGPERTKPRYVKIDRTLIPFEFKSSNDRKRIILSEQNNACSNCKLDSWMNKVIPMSYHHEDGNKKNNKRDNVAYLCFNCHAQTDNFGFKNRQHSEETKNKFFRKLSNSEPAI